MGKLHKKSQKIRGTAIASVWPILSLWLILSGGLIQTAAADAKPAADLSNQLYKEGKKLEDRGNYAGALARYEAGLKAAEASKNKETAARNWLGIGLVYRRWADYQKAMPACQTAAKLAEELDDKIVLARALGRIADIQERQGQYAEAKRSYERALKLSRVAKDKAGAGWALLGIGNVYISQGNHSQVAAYHQRALKIAEDVGDRSQVAEMLGHIGLMYWTHRVYSRAIEYYQRALNVREESGDKSGIIHALNDLGTGYKNSGSFGEALTCYRRSLKTAEELGDAREIAVAFSFIGNVHQEQGSYAAAFEPYQKALKTMEGLADKSGTAQILALMAVVYWEQGSYREAVACLQRARRLWEELGNRSGTARMLSDLGHMYMDQGSSIEAISCFQRALRIREETGDKRGAAEMLNRIGAAYEKQEAYSEAIEYLQRAIKVFEELENNVGIFATLINLGIAYQNQGLPHEAVACSQKALKLAKEMGGKWEMVWALNNLGDVYQHQGFYGKALLYYQESLKISRELHAQNHMGNALNRMGHAYLKLQKYARTLETAQQALALGENVKRPSVIWEARYNLASVYEKLGQAARALKDYKLAIEEVEKIRVRIDSEEEKAEFFADRIVLYKDLIRFLYKLETENPSAGYLQQAFEYAERAKARAFLDLLSEARIDLQSSADEKLLAMEKRVLNRISRTQKQLLDANISEKSRAALLIDLERLEKEDAEVKREIRRASPKYSEFLYPQPLSLKTVQSEVLENGQALLEYFLGEEESFLWLVQKNRALVYKLPPKAKLEKKVRLYLELISERPASTSRMKSHYDGSHQLYRELILPVIAELQQVKSLIIVPDGLLYYLPFETLIGESTPEETRPRYLIEAYAISYVPSASILAYIKAQMRESIQHPDKRKELLAFGDPIYPGAVNLPLLSNAAENILPEPRAINLSQLPFSAEEVQGISRYFSRDGRKIRLREQACEEAVKSPETGKFKIVHFAAHGFFDEQRPHRSSIILSLAGQGEEDGFLQVNEIFNLKLHADLVVLSACQTALGRLTRGEGLMGMIRAFIYAGSTALVPSLWHINDKASADFMKDFYFFLAKGETKAQALRQAKLRMVASEKYSHPYYWAPFILVGESASPIPISKNGFTKTEMRILVITLLIVVLVMMAFYGLRRSEH